MAFRTHMKKSGQKRVFDQETKDMHGLNEAARNVFGSKSAGLIPGIAGLSDPVNPRQASPSQKITLIRRRRKLASLYSTDKHVIRAR
jgi:hypothetical protein